MSEMKLESNDHARKESPILIQCSELFTGDLPEIMSRFHEKGPTDSYFFFFSIELLAVRRRQSECEAERQSRRFCGLRGRGRSLMSAAAAACCSAVIVDGGAKGERPLRCRESALRTDGRTDDGRTDGRGCGSAAVLFMRTRPAEARRRMAKFS